MLKHPAGQAAAPLLARPVEFHVARAARDHYRFDEGLFQANGNVVFANFQAARVFAQRMNEKRDLVAFPEQAVSAGQINALGLVDEMLHVLIHRYRQDVNPRIIADTLARLEGTVGRAALDRTLRRFTEEFPPMAVYRRELTTEEYLGGVTGGVPNRELVLEEMLLLWLGNANPAFQPYRELFDDGDLERESPYALVTREMTRFLDGQPGFGERAGPGGSASLLATLRAPALASPNSLTGQLEFLLQRLGGVLGQMLFRVLSSLDLIREEEKMVFVGPAGPGGGGEARVYEYGGEAHEAERFSPDRDWMPSLVLVAKNAFVWLDQLSRRYGRQITTLDQVPDEELDWLKRQGITGLWLIGLWERSVASKKIKQLMGNEDAVASAYSLYDYTIAGDLGGEGAVQVLRERAWARGIRLASDMVPNHTGIDGKWVIEHPHWFISLPYSPYPAYTFNGPDLSQDDRVGIFLEDHYYTRSDAAVVFKRVDRHTGSESFIYHGNDGTSMPWNDTAQLNYLSAEVREAVIQTILHVARQFPVIRFDAAMTLAKKHVQRLWFPEPGSGGAIPSRSEHAMTRAAFDAAMPHEFWREVVDRVAQEAPDTLLLAEAFWMMEGYFVRTLGMHRVYNSAFMNMLRDEKNSEYRQIMRNTLEFDPEIMKRWVNFMNNPDEKTAVEQFGKGDKYFGVATIMSTMPGLPMIGHGQVEGYAEKYGMEYRRAYWDEQADSHLVDRHERQIFPLLHRRHIFAQVDDFLMYDLVTPEGYVCEDVFAYSNDFQGQRSLVIYHNRYAQARGWIKESAPYNARVGEGREMRRRNLAAGLALEDDERAFTIFRDQVSGLEYLRSSRELHQRGLYVELGAYQHHAFVDFRDVRDGPDRAYAHLNEYLGGRGVPSVDDALKDLLLRPAHDPFRELVSADLLTRLLEARAKAAIPAELLDEVEARLARMHEGVLSLSGGQGDSGGLAKRLRGTLEVLLMQPDSDIGAVPPSVLPGAVEAAPERHTDPHVWAPLIAWVFTHRLGELSGQGDVAAASRSLLDEWQFGRIASGCFRDLGLEEGDATRATALLKLLVGRQEVFARSVSASGAAAFAQSLLGDRDVQAYLGVNRFRDVLYFSREGLERFLEAAVPVAAATPDGEPGHAEAWAAVAHRLRAAAERSGYRLESFMRSLRGDEAASVGEAEDEAVATNAGEA